MPDNPYPASTAAVRLVDLEPAVLASWRQARQFLLEILPAALFLLLAMPLCLFLALVTPIGQVADEPAHIAKAASLMGGQIVGRRAEVVRPDGSRAFMSGVDVDIAPSVASLIIRNDGNDAKLTRERLDRARQLPWSAKRQFQALGPIAGYFPIFYVPAAAGMKVAKWRGAVPLQAVVVGRLANAVAYGLVGALAIFFARRGRAVLFCTLSVPMALSLGGSLNQDGLMIASAALAAGLLSWSWETGSRRAYLAAAILVALVIVAKPPYVPLALMLLLPLPSFRDCLRDAGFRSRLWATGCVCLAGLLWTAVVAVHVTAPTPMEPYLPGPLWMGDPSIEFQATDVAAQLSVIRAHPLHILALPWIKIAQETSLIDQTIGILGWLSVWLPRWLYDAWTYATVLAVAADCLRARRSAARGSGVARSRLRPTDAGLLVIGALATVEGIYLSQYLIWTHVGLDRIDGPQGRYLLPLIPMLALALPRLPLPGARLLRPALLAAPVLAACADNAVLPVMMITLFHTG